MPYNFLRVWKKAEGKRYHNQIRYNLGEDYFIIFFTLIMNKNGSKEKATH